MVIYFSIFVKKLIFYFLYNFYSMDKYKIKYFIYKNKYLKLKNKMYGGANWNCTTCTFENSNESKSCSIKKRAKNYY